MQPRGLLRGQHRLHPLSRLAAAFFRAGVNAQRSAVRVEFVHVDHAQSGRRQRARRGQQGQVGEMLVVDRVVLPPLDQPQQVRELQRHRALVFDQRSQARRETPDIRHVGEDVVRGHQVSPAVLPGDLTAGLRPQELDLRPDAPGARRLCHVRGRLDTQHRDAGRLEVLKQVAVVAGHLGDEAVRSQIQPPDHRLRVPLRMRHPRVGVRRKISVVGKDILAGHISGKLYEQAGVAQANVKRIEDFWRRRASPREHSSHIAETSRDRRTYG